MTADISMKKNIYETWNNTEEINREEMDNREMNGGSEVGGKQQYLAIERETLLYAGIDPDDGFYI